MDVWGFLVKYKWNVSTFWVTELGLTARFLYSTTSLKEMLYFLIHYIFMTAFVTLQIRIFAYKTYTELVKYDVLL